MDGWITIGTKIDNKQFDAQIKDLENTLETLEEEYKIAIKDADFPEEELNKYQVEIEKTKNKIVGLKKQQEALNQATIQYDNTFGKSIKKVGKLALGIFSIRSAYMLIRRAASELSQENEQLAQKLNAIRGSLTNLLAPAIEWIVDKVYQLLGYLNVITKEFFGTDLFAKSSKSAKSTSKSVKEIKKQLAGFDEMNVLNSNASGGGGGASGGGKMPEPKINENFIKVVKNFKKMWNDILDIDQREARELLTQSSKNWGMFKAGIFDVTQGIVKMLDSLIHGDFKKAGEGFIQLLQGLIELAIGLVKGLFNSIKKILNSISELVFSIITIPIKTAIETTKTMFNSLLTSAKKVFEGVKKLFTGDLKGALNSFKEAFKTILEGLKTTLKTPLNVMIGWINKVINGLNKISIKIPDWVPEFGGKTWGFNIKAIPKLAQGGIVNNPGRGVNMGSYVAGERGAEAVLPLTDDTLQRLANMIPINVSVTNTMNGRVISRELQRVNAQSSFANNW